MDIWKRLFLDGEYSNRRRILSGLEPKHIAARPTGATHSIYEELWHITKWQNIVLSRDKALREAWNQGSGYPSFPASIQENEWHELVEEFLKGLEAAVDVARSDVAGGSEDPEKVILHDEFTSLAVHNAYHLGKIVALRQRLGCWPAPS